MESSFLIDFIELAERLEPYTRALLRLGRSYSGRRMGFFFGGGGTLKDWSVTCTSTNKAHT